MRFVPIQTIADMNVFHPARDASGAEHLSQYHRETQSLCIISVFSTNCHFDICIFSSSANGTKIQTKVQI